MAYGMRTYQFGGLPEVAFAKQFRYLSLYIAKKDVLDAHRTDLRGLSVGKGCIRYQRPEQIDWVLVEHLLNQTVDSAARPC